MSKATNRTVLKLASQWKKWFYALSECHWLRRNVLDESALKIEEYPDAENELYYELCHLAKESMRGYSNSIIAYYSIIKDHVYRLMHCPDVDDSTRHVLQCDFLDTFLPKHYLRRSIPGVPFEPPYCNQYEKYATARYMVDRIYSNSVSIGRKMDIASQRSLELAACGWGVLDSMTDRLAGVKWEEELDTLCSMFLVDSKKYFLYLETVIKEWSKKGV